IEPGGRLVVPGEQNLDLLPAGVDVVVALILVVLKGREVPHLVHQRPDAILRLQRRQELVRAPSERALEALQPLDAGLELPEARRPIVPIATDAGQVPLIAVWNTVAVGEFAG